MFRFEPPGASSPLSEWVDKCRRFVRGLLLRDPVNSTCRSKRAFALLGCSAVFAVATLAVPASAQQGDQASPKSTATAKRKVIRTKGHLPMSGSDPYVKSRTTTSTAESAATLAPNKTKPKPGSAAAKVCAVHVDNWTSAMVHVFIGGDYAGSIGAGGEMFVSTPNAATTFYARIDTSPFDWIPLGPVDFDCDGIYSFTITP
jgi:hypothetical protein